LTTQLGEALARIHAIEPGTHDGVLPGPADDPAVAQIAEWERQLDEIGEPLPAVELGLRWLRANAPEPAEPRLVHGDFRLGNFIVDPDGLAAVIDWELAHLGDPAEDIGWLCIRSWRFGNDEEPVAGVGQLDEFVSAYEAAGGAPVDRERVRYWEAFGNVKWAVICARQAHDHLTGVRRSHELASLGRRVCEPEWDLLQLMSS
jgi:aminoglycoside phosphotransferase (APT) family kinase protein